MNLILKKITVFLMLSVLWFAVGELQAVPAYPGLIKFEQPDGSKLNIYLYGDEKVSWAETLDGYSLLFSKQGFYEYAVSDKSGNMIPSGITAVSIGERTAKDISFLQKVKKKLRYNISQIQMMKQIWNIYDKEKSKDFPTTGERELVCILIGFTDLAFTETQVSFDNLFNQVGYTYNGADGSVYDYYYETSYQQLELTVTVAGSYTAANTMAYYGQDGGGSHSLNVRELVTEAVILADADVDYTNFDNDNDGNVDAVYIIFAGYGQEAGGPEDAIWSHAWNITPITLDGKVISRYSCSPEFRGNSGTDITNIGVICHEFGHVLGAIDYYDTNYDISGSYDGTGEWDLMAGGSWNNNGATPAPQNPYTKCYTYNWAVPTLLTVQQNIVINNSTENAHFYRYDTQNASDNEFFLIENKQQIGFNAAVPGHGMIIYHADNNWISSNWGNNSVNTTSHQGFFPMAANATTENGVMTSGSSTINTSGCPWPGTSNKTTFTDITIPNSKDWDGDLTEKPLISISENGDIVTFCFLSCGTADDPQTFNATAISHVKINLAWEKNSSQHPVMVAYSESETFGIPVNGTVYNANDPIVGGGTVLYNGDLNYFKHEGLNSNTTYYYKAWSVNANDYSEGITANATTAAVSGCLAIDYMASMAETFVGSYSDLGTNGTIITTADFDNSNSSPVDIGFNFHFNCIDFTQFILNTNGFIKLGDTPPSSASLFFNGGNNADGGIFNSADPLDVNFISIFNHDLEAGTDTEYRVYTSGTAPDRVCTIQFKGVKDKTTTPVQQYDNMQFQIKLYETTNVVEFVYGDWVPSSNASEFKTSACGLKGSSNSDEDLLVVNKGSTQTWSSVNFTNGNYSTTATLNFGHPPERPKPEIGRTFRFIQQVDFNLSVGEIYSMGESSLNFTPSQDIMVNIVNNGFFAMSDIDVELTISGANSLTDIVNIPFLNVGQNQMVAFTEFSPDFLGETTVNITIGDDDNNEDNSKDQAQDVTEYRCNYSEIEGGEQAAYGGSTTGLIFLNRYTVNGSALVESVQAYISNSATVGSTVYGVVLNPNGTILGQSANVTIQNEDLGTWYTFDIITPPVITDSDFFPGLAIEVAANYAMGTQNEDPIRFDLYFISPLEAGSPPTSSESGRFMVGATLAHLEIGIDETKSDLISVFPNPSSGVFNIETHNIIYKIEVIDISGRILIEKDIIGNENTIDLSEFGKGIYVFKLINENNTILKKVVVQ